MKLNKSPVLRRLLYLPRVLTKLERYLVVLLFIVGLMSLLQMVNNRTKTVIPAYGGTLVEGVVKSNPLDLQRTLVSLDHRGLVKLSKDNQVEPALAKKWTVEDNGKTYRFTLDEGVDTKIVTESLADASSKIGKLDIEAQGNEVIIKLAQPFSPFLKTLSEPIIPIGPYKLDKSEGNKIFYSANNNFPTGAPYIEKIVIHVAETKEELDSWVTKGEVQVALGSNVENKKFSQNVLTLERKPVLFFNNAIPILQKATVRSRLASGQKLDKEIEITLKTIDNSKIKELADKIKTSFLESGAKVNIEFVSVDELKNNILPKRDYDMVLIGIENGRDPDPYTLWHSSQISPEGQNYSNFFNKQTDKLLEEIRMNSDPEIRKKKTEEFEKIFNVEKPAIFYDNDTAPLLTSIKIKGVRFTYLSDLGDHLGAIEHWYVKEKRK